MAAEEVPGVIAVQDKAAAQVQTITTTKLTEMFLHKAATLMLLKGNITSLHNNRKGTIPMPSKTNITSHHNHRKAAILTTSKTAITNLHKHHKAANRSPTPGQLPAARPKLESLPKNTAARNKSHTHKHMQHPCMIC